MAIIDDFPTLSSSPTTGDELPIERGTTTYKIDYDALASAIISKLGGDPVTTSHGGTGAATAKAARENLSVPATLYFDTATWASIKAKLDSLSTYSCATFYAPGNVASLLTGGDVTSSLKGVITVTGSSTYDCIGYIGAGASSGYLVTWRINSPTTSGATIGTVMHYMGANTTNVTSGVTFNTTNVDTDATIEKQVFTCGKVCSVFLTFKTKVDVANAGKELATGLPVPANETGYTYGCQFVGEFGSGSTFNTAIFRINSSGKLITGYMGSTIPAGYTVRLGCTYIMA